MLGTIDFTDVSLQEEKIRTLFENGFLYLGATSLGRDTLYPDLSLVEREQEITRELVLPAKKPSKKKT